MLMNALFWDTLILTISPNIFLEGQYTKYVEKLEYNWSRAWKPKEVMKQVKQISIEKMVWD